MSKPLSKQQHAVLRAFRDAAPVDYSPVLESAARARLLHIRATRVTPTIESLVKRGLLVPVLPREQGYSTAKYIAVPAEDVE